jgi:hypothetical protein
MQNVAAIQSNAAQLGEGNGNNAYELGRLHLVPSDQFVGGDVQTYYEQGYNYQDHQYQPPAEDLEKGGALVFVDAKCALNAKHTASRTKLASHAQRAKDVPVNFS